MKRNSIKNIVLLSVVVSTSLSAQSTHEQDMARQNQHVYEENMRAQQRRQAEQQGAPPPYQPRQAMKWVSSHGAVVAHMDATNYWAVMGARSFDTATNAALKHCTEAMGAGCMVLVDGSNGHFSIGIASDGTVASGFGATLADARRQMREACAECREESSLVSLPWQEPLSWGAMEIQIADESFSRLQSVIPSHVKRRSHILLALPKNYSSDKPSGSIWIASGPSWDDLKSRLLQACGADAGNDCEIGMYVSGQAVIVEFRTDAGEEYFRTAESKGAANAMVARYCKSLNTHCSITKIHSIASGPQFGRLPPAPARSSSN